jgi:hypothetical protein
MQRLATLKGRGNVEVQGNKLGDVDYRIDVWQGPGFKTAFGTASGEKSVLAAAFGAGSATLHLDRGGTVQFLVSQLSRHGHAEIQIDGPVPGY